MRYSTLRNKRACALSAVESLFSCAEILGMSSDEITSAYSRILSDYKDIPRWAKEYLQGVFDTRWKDLYRTKLVFGGYYKGVFYSTHSSRPDYYAKHGIEPVQWAENARSGLIKINHYWITTRKPMPFGKES